MTVQRLRDLTREYSAEQMREFIEEMESILVIARQVERENSVPTESPTTRCHRARLNRN